MIIGNLMHCTFNASRVMHGLKIIAKTILDMDSMFALHLLHDIIPNDTKYLKI